MRNDRVVATAFVSSAVLAGGNAVAIRFSNRELAPVWGASLRFVLAATILFVVIGVLRLQLPRGGDLVGTLLWGLFQFAGAFGFAYYALVHIQAGLGQTLLALVPLATLLLAVVQGQERLHLAAVMGTLLSLAGVGVISGASLPSSVPVLAVLAVFGSVLCFAQANVIVRRHPDVHPVTMNALGMLAGVVVLVAVSLIARETWTLPERPETWAALGYVVGVGSVVVFLLVVFVLHHWEASRASYVMVIVPLVTVVLSAWLDDEPVGPGLVGGGLLVIAGVYIGAIRPARVRARTAVDTT